MNKTEYEDLRIKMFARLAPSRELLNSPQGISLLKELRAIAYFPPGGVYIPGSFDQTAFRLGAIWFYEQLEEISKGLNDGRRTDDPSA